MVIAMVLDSYSKY